MKPRPTGRKAQPTGDPRLKTPARKALRARVAALGLPCHRCGHPINYTGPWDLDELLARDDGGDPLDPTNVAPTHVTCNRAAGARRTNAKRRARGGAERSTTANRW